MQYGGGGYGQRQPGAPKARIVMTEARKSYVNKWQTDLMGAPCANPGFCLYAACCNVCVAYSHRKEIMFNDLTNYTCCNGDTCISGRCGEKSCPEFCLCVEAFCCFPSAVATNRFMIQDEMRVENTPCDNFLIGFMLCLNQLACIFRVAAMISQNDDIERAADILDCMADVTYCSVCACMQTQHQEQLKMRNPHARPPTQGVMQPPAPQVIYQMPPGAQPAGATHFQQQHYQQQQPPAPTYGYSQPPPPQYGYSQPPPPQGGAQYRY